MLLYKADVKRDSWVSFWEENKTSITNKTIGSQNKTNLFLAVLSTRLFSFKISNLLSSTPKK